MGFFAVACRWNAIGKSGVASIKIIVRFYRIAQDFFEKKVRIYDHVDLNSTRPADILPLFYRKQELQQLLKFEW